MTASPNFSYTSGGSSSNAAISTKNQCVAETLPSKGAAVESAVNVGSQSVELVNRFLEGHVKGDADMILSTMHPKALAVFADAEMTMTCYAFELGNLFRSFPDLKFGWKSVTEVEPGVVVVEDLQVSGKHTGVPYSFGPYPPVEAKGAMVRLDPETLTMTCQEGVITKTIIQPNGPCSGPPGVYEQIGGILF